MVLVLQKALKSWKGARWLCSGAVLGTEAARPQPSLSLWFRSVAET